jgi:hypothetical protein
MLSAAQHDNGPGALHDAGFMIEVLTLTANDIYERMVATILDHRLPPCTKLIEDLLATAFGVSHTPFLFFNRSPNEKSRMESPMKKIHDAPFD